MEVILIRHTSVDVPPGVCYGQTDVPLKPTFEAEAAVTAENLKAYLPFDHVYTSPLTRCVRLATYCGYPDAERDKRIMEINFGDWEMKPFEQNEDPRLQEWYADYMNVAATGGESFAMQYRRVGQFLDELRKKPYTRVAIFAHVGVLQQRIYAAQVVPIPSRVTVFLFGRGAMAAAEEDGGEGVLNEQVALFVEGLFIQQIVVERVGEQFEIAGSLEVVELRNTIQRGLVEPVLAGG